MAWSLGLAVLMVLGTLQISPIAMVAGIRADPLLAMAMAWAALAGPRQGAAFGLASGAVEDMLVGGGVRFTAIRALLGLLAGTVRPVLNIRQAIIIIPLVGAATVIQEAVMAMAHHNWLRFSTLWLPAMLVDAAISWPIYLLAKAIWRPGRGPSPAIRRN